MQEVITFGCGALAGMLILWIVFLLTGKVRSAKGGGASRSAARQPEPTRPKPRTMWD